MRVWANHQFFRGKGASFENFFVAVTSPSVGPCEVHSVGDATLSHNKRPKHAL